MPARLFPILQMRIIDQMEAEGLTAEEVVVLASGTAIGRMKSMPRDEAEPLALEIIAGLRKHILDRPDVEEG